MRCRAVPVVAGGVRPHASGCSSSGVLYGTLRVLLSEEDEPIEERVVRFDVNHAQAYPPVLLSLPTKTSRRLDGADCESRCGSMPLATAGAAAVVRIVSPQRWMRLTDAFLA